MEMFDLTMNKDYYVPLSREEMIEKLEYYKSFAVSLDKKYALDSKEYYELLDSLINLEISAFDIKFSSYTMVPSLLSKVMKYNIWQLTQKTVDRFNKREIILIKEPEQHGFVKVYENVIANLSLKPPYAFTQPSIIINSYETDYDLAKQSMLELRSRYECLKKEQREYRIRELYSESIIEENEEETHYISDEEELYLECDEKEQNKKTEEMLSRYIKLCEDVEETRKQLNVFRKSICLYKNGIYKEVSHALLEEYHVPHEVGKSLVKTLPWITLKKNSF